MKFRAIIKSFVKRAVTPAVENPGSLFAFFFLCFFCGPGSFELGRVFEVFAVAYAQNSAPRDEVALGTLDTGLGRSSSPIRGNRRTSLKAIQNFLYPDGKNRDLKKTDLEDLRNLAIFERVDLVGNQVSVKERWTTVPVFKIQSGGGLVNYTVGVVDPNFLGRLIALGAQYEQAGGLSSGQVQFRKPRLFKRFNVGADLGVSSRPRFLVNQGEVTSAMVVGRQRVAAFIEDQISPNLTVGIGFDYNKDRLSVAPFTSDYQDRFSDYFSRGFLGGEREKLWTRAFARWGRVNRDIPFFEGHSVALELRQAFQGFVSDTNLFSLQLQGRWFRRHKNHNYGGRFIWDYTSSSFPEDQVFTGGFDRIRGFFDGQFITRSTGVLNFEYRYRMLSLDSGWCDLQGVMFSDSGWLVDLDQWVSSVGAGLRIIVPKIYGFNVRVDWAQVLRGPPGQSLSFGLQQFF